MPKSPESYTWQPLTGPSVTVTLNNFETGGLWEVCGPGPIHLGDCWEESVRWGRAPNGRLYPQRRGWRWCRQGEDKNGNDLSAIMRGGGLTSKYEAVSALLFELRGEGKV